MPNFFLFFKSPFFPGKDFRGKKKFLSGGNFIFGWRICWRGAQTRGHRNFFPILVPKKGAQNFIVKIFPRILLFFFFRDEKKTLLTGLFKGGGFTELKLGGSCMEVLLFLHFWEVFCKKKGIWNCLGPNFFRFKIWFFFISPWNQGIWEILFF